MHPQAIHRSVRLLLGTVLGAVLPAQAAPPDAAPAAPPAAPLARSMQHEFVQLAGRAFPSVVTVRSFVRGPAAALPSAGPAEPTEPKSGWVAAPSSERDYPGFVPYRSGSGFFVGTDGDLLTVLQPLQVDADRLADLIEIETMDGHRILCDVVGIEPTLHLAVLRGAVFSSWAKPAVAPLQFGDSDALELGSWLLACGDPLGPERFLGIGLLAAKPSRDCYQELMSATYMQATMPVHPGAYGSPLLDLDGNVVGILSQLDLDGHTALTSPGSAWALPSKILVGLYESIRAAGTTQSPWLGFSVLSRAELATTRGLPAYQQMVKPPHGILLENVYQPSPAASAGLQPDDFLTHFGDAEIHAPVDFQRQLYLAGVGRRVSLRFCRAGESFTRELLIAARPAEARPR